MANVTAIILAAGLSRRMGTNKLFLDFEDKPIVQHVLYKIAQSNADEVVVVSSEVSIDRLHKMIDPTWKLIDNPDYETGMTSSIQKGVANANSDNGLMICLADQPLITVEDYNQCIDIYADESLRDGKIIVVPFAGNKKGNPVIFSPFYRQDILDHSEPEGCKEIIQMNKSHVVRVAIKNEGILNDVDTPESYQQLIGKK